METLPIDEALETIARKLEQAGALVLLAPPGSGKTTAVPGSLLDHGLAGPHQRIYMLEPRRVAARAAARRIAALRGGRLGDEVGYRVRFENRTCARTRIVILTEGLLTRLLMQEADLPDAGVVILDEFHERSIHVDLALALLMELRETIRPDLKILVMSATLDPVPISRFLGNCPVVEVPGRAHSITHHYLPVADDRPLPVRVVSALETALASKPSGVLIFLPGAPEIRRVLPAVQGPSGNRYAVYPLYGDLSADDQDRALAPDGPPRIVLATNIAESSLTIPGIDTVIDTGLAKVPHHDPVRGMNRLDLVRISAASAAQRAGRAGRLGPGIAYHLWTRAQDAHLAPAEVPEVARIDLAPIILEVLGWSARDPRTFGWFEPPPEIHVARALDLLTLLGALEPESFQLTPLGHQLRAFPLHPRIGAMLIASHARGLTREGALLAALTGERDVLRPGAGRGATTAGPSDLLLRAEMLEYPRGNADVDPDAAAAVMRIQRQLVEIAQRTLGPEPERPDGGPPLEQALRAVLAGFPDRVCHRRSPGSDRFAMVGGRGAVLAANSVVTKAQLVVAIDIDDSRYASESLIRMASGVEEAWLADTGGTTDRTVVRFHREREAVEVVRERRYRDLWLADYPGATADPAAVSAVLTEAAAADPWKALAPKEAALSLLERVAFLRRTGALPELPDLEGKGLGALVGEISYGASSFAELRRLPLDRLIRQHLGHNLASRIDELAPERLTVPSGSQIALRYGAEGPPVLAVRMQEIFGWRATPRVAAGRVPVKLELLGPNYRPVQITQDLESFWKTTYPEVRKDLRARYPKHSWPENPLEATAVRGARRPRS